MHSTYQAWSGAGTMRAGAGRRYGLTDPAVIDAYVSRRVEDPRLLSGRGSGAASGPSYADFFAAPTA
ncbi:MULTISPECIES: hypothetical protein [unclassified Curtobacterium]|uniref:hypothetical protein n=1 Tax=unclassified Curtobacterium TaxID=257496 RepID=UPI000DA899A9|nr:MULTISPECIES: hypothetical protein [unclassified Curtobacterium]PZE22973.1 hypothetical protein DEI86_16065 [Curtobacterium sp. MCBD17_028]PZE76250.1 hypothetical protein DEI82_07115 [Curtobacterium sp. MCBD17_019]PZF56922.1 hypothetical protein DEI81_15700 [Curtobacterium sp. MCBD17_013]PZF60103.1 hypothetical protein DEI92_06905 [Curtobacterium sp. MCBD17_034]PZM34788.1 hypothetical protein DEI90_04890 [Curtobacterium sp. MCBD17_031]